MYLMSGAFSLFAEPPTGTVLLPRANKTARSDKSVAVVIF